ncbi:MAG: VanZ family protein [Halanaeroarchaeum sp.]
MRRWSANHRWWAVAVGTVLLVAALVPSPLERTSTFDPVGPDTVLHFLGHAVFAFALASAFGAGRHSDREAAVLSIVVSVVYGFVIGRIQRWVPGRANEPSDLFAGLLGSCGGAILWYRRSRRPER